LALTRPVAVDTTTGKNAMNIATTMPDLLPVVSCQLASLFRSAARYFR
jgi:hypothetical protein